MAPPKMPYDCTNKFPKKTEAKHEITYPMSKLYCCLITVII